MADFPYDSNQQPRLTPPGAIPPPAPASRQDWSPGGLMNRAFSAIPGMPQVQQGYQNWAASNRAAMPGWLRSPADILNQFMGSYAGRAMQTMPLPLAGVRGPGPAASMARRAITSELGGIPAGEGMLGDPLGMRRLAARGSQDVDVSQAQRTFGGMPNERFPNTNPVPNSRALVQPEPGGPLVPFNQPAANPWASWGAPVETGPQLPWQIGALPSPAVNRLLPPPAAVPSYLGRVNPGAENLDIGAPLGGVASRAESLGAPTAPPIAPPNILGRVNPGAENLTGEVSSGLGGGSSGARAIGPGEAREFTMTRNVGAPSAPAGMPWWQSASEGNPAGAPLSAPPWVGPAAVAVGGAGAAIGAHMATGRDGATPAFSAPPYQDTFSPPAGFLTPDQSWMNPDLTQLPPAASMTPTSGALPVASYADANSMEFAGGARPLPGSVPAGFESSGRRAPGEQNIYDLGNYGGNTNVYGSASTPGGRVNQFSDQANIATLRGGHAAPMPTAGQPGAGNPVAQATPPPIEGEYQPAQTQWRQGWDGVMRQENVAPPSSGNQTQNFINDLIAKASQPLSHDSLAANLNSAYERGHATRLLESILPHQMGAQAEMARAQLPWTMGMTPAEQARLPYLESHADYWREMADVNRSRANTYQGRYEDQAPKTVELPTGPVDPLTGQQTKVPHMWDAARGGYVPIQALALPGTPAAALEFLKAHPDQAPAFKAKYGYLPNQPGG
jgi:hypothetical protein